MIRITNKTHKHQNKTGLAKKRIKKPKTQKHSIQQQNKIKTHIHTHIYFYKRRWTATTPKHKKRIRNPKSKPSWTKTKNITAKHQQKHLKACYNTQKPRNKRKRFMEIEQPLNQERTRRKHEEQQWKKKKKQERRITLLRETKTENKKLWWNPAPVKNENRRTAVGSKNQFR